MWESRPVERITSCLTIASLFIVLALALLAFRIWRERELRRRNPAWSGWLAKADYLILMPIVLSLLFVVLPFLTISNPTTLMLTIAQGSCAASATLLATYPLAIIDRYRTETGGERRREGANLFIGACILAVLAPVAIFVYC